MKATHYLKAGLQRSKDREVQIRESILRFYIKAHPNSAKYLEFYSIHKGDIQHSPAGSGEVRSPGVPSRLW